MTEQQTESQNQEQQTQEQQPAAAPVEGYSNAEIEAMAKAEAPKPTEQAPEKEEGDEGESEGDEEDAAGEGEEGEEKKSQENVSEGQKQRSKRVTRERFDEVNEQKNTYKSRADELQRELETERARSQRLSDFIRKATEGEAKKDELEEEEIIDEVLGKKVSGVSTELKEVKQEIAAERFQRSLSDEDAIGRKSLTDYDNAVSFVVATEAHQVIARHAALGKKISEEKAIEEAMKTINRDLYDVHQQGGRSGTIAKYVYDRAIARGFTPVQAKKAAEKSKVDMKAVERARQEAGAPAVERESVKINGANWNDELAGRASKEFKPSDKRYLEKWGL